MKNYYLDIKSILIRFLIAVLIIPFSQRFLNAQIHTGSFEFEGRTRSYMVFLPQNFQSNMPVVFNLHGYYVDAQFQMDYTLLNNMADTSGFIVVYPKAIWPGFNSGQILPEGYPQIDLTINDVGFISALLDTIEARYDVDLSRIYSCGFSNGGIMSYRLAGQLGYRFAAIAAVSGQFCDITANVSDPLREFPVLHIHGTEDVNLPFMGADPILLSVDSTLNYWIQNNGCQSNPETILLPDLDQSDSSIVQKSSYTNCSGTSKILFYKIINGGHNWPGTNPPLTDSWAGHTNQDINANVEIWNFFKDFENPLVNIAWAKTFKVFPKYLNTQGDTLFITAYITNPENHSVSVRVNIHGETVAFSDSLLLYDDGLHFDENPNDNIWGNSKWLADLVKDIYLVDIYTEDFFAGTIVKYHWSDSVTVTTTAIVENESSIPTEFVLKQNYPNPLNPSTQIVYSINKFSHVEINIFNSVGQKIKTLVNKQQYPGNYSVTWDGTDEENVKVASGTYLYQLQVGEQRQTKKTIFLN